MTTQIKTIEKKIASQYTISLGKRILWIALIWAIQLLYLPTSEMLTGGIEPKLPVDVFPIWPIWVVPYVLCYPLWTAGFAWAAFKMNDRMFRSFTIAFLVTCSVSIAIFVIFPTYVPPSVLYGNDIYTRLLRFFHEGTGRYDALPSGHIYVTALLVFFYSLWYPRHKPVWISILVIVSFSTLFTAQHYILDILAGLLVAGMGYYAGLKWTGFPRLQTQPAKEKITFPPGS